MITVGQGDGMPLLIVPRLFLDLRHLALRSITSGGGFSFPEPIDAMC